ncbi:MAG: hypothetical protein C4527_05875 [Candidatus Omnitrophota bacterium]|nr:MAG: hypothetical protein C4527_05875 [Candidatus Omnitrophota bacterium]
MVNSFFLWNPFFCWAPNVFYSGKIIWATTFIKVGFALLIATLRPACSAWGIGPPQRDSVPPPRDSTGPATGGSKRRGRTVRVTSPDRGVSPALKTFFCPQQSDSNVETSVIAMRRTV